MKTKSDNGMIVCVNCDQVEGYEVTKKYINSHGSRSNIVKNSVYIRRYHVKNSIYDICSKNKIQITHDKINQIIKIFEEIERTLPQLNGNRTRTISTYFIITQLFKMVNLPYENIR